jgi:hypothetical protein
LKLPICQIWRFWVKVNQNLNKSPHYKETPERNKYIVLLKHM